MCLLPLELNSKPECPKPKATTRGSSLALLLLLVCHGGIQDMAQKIHFVQSPRCRCGSEQGNISWQFISQEQPVSTDRAHTVHLPPSSWERFPFLPQPGEFVCSEVALPTQSLLRVLPLCSKPKSFKAGQAAVGSSRQQSN